ncbi:exported protein of unknown function [Candidatus Nitrospira inopinata]|uniref:Uncharacterized protein n=1 Tax=Candidatus Nitrospira inopinata TaxID=1715989 RepID=A0A0S4KUT1_9BACT|nr:exported protein of unknown function [Candidatus Nitrospira inopinata]
MVAHRASLFLSLTLMMDLLPSSARSEDDLSNHPEDKHDFGDRRRRLYRLAHLCRTAPGRL